MSLEERCDLVEFENLKGTPWQLKEGREQWLRDKPCLLVERPTAQTEVVRVERRCRETRSPLTEVLRAPSSGHSLGNVYATNARIV